MRTATEALLGSEVEGIAVGTACRPLCVSSREPLWNSYPYEAAIEEAVQNTLGRFKGRLTRLDVLIKDINGDKGGVVKHCSIEARPKGLDPVAADHEAENITAALNGAAEKLKTQLTRHFDKLGHH